MFGYIPVSARTGGCLGECGEVLEACPCRRFLAWETDEVCLRERGSEGTVEEEGGRERGQGMRKER